MKKRWIAWLLTVTMCLSLLPVGVLAADEEAEEPEEEEIVLTSEEEITEPTEKTPEESETGEQETGEQEIGETAADAVPREEPAVTEPTETETPETTEETPAPVETELTGGTILSDTGDGGVVASGTCGTTLAWTLMDDGVLTISGSGDMEDFLSFAYVPWKSYKTTVTAVSVGSGVTGIGDYAFYGFTALTAVSLPAGLLSIGEYAFRGCELLTAVSLPGSVTTIGEYAFENCKALGSIVLPDSVTSLGTGVFNGCSALQSATVGSGLTAIPRETFRECTALTSVTIPATVTTIESQSFYNCRISDVYYGGTQKQWDAISIYSNEIKNGTLHHSGPAPITGECGDNLTWTLTEGDLTVSGSGAMSFSGSAPWYEYRDEIVTVTLEEGVTNIIAGAFNGCAALTKVTIPATVTSISVIAFEGCTSLTEFDVSGSNTVYTDYPGDLYSKSWDTLILAAKGASGRYIVDGSTKEIGERALADCTGITEIMIPIDVTVIGDYALAGCTGLTSVILPDGLTSLGGGAFRGCTNLETMQIPYNVTAIGADTFRGCSALEEIVIPGAVETIGAGAFYGCGSLKKITYGGTEEEWLTASADAFEEGALSGVTVIFAGMTATGICGDDATWILYDDGNLVVSGSGMMGGGSDIHDYIDLVLTAEVGEGITVVGGSLFDYCENLTKVTLPSTATKIDYNTFYLCKKLKEINIPQGVTTIGYDAFNGCAALEEIVLPESVTTIVTNAFRSCSALKTVTMGSAVTEINSGAFCNDTKLTDVYYSGTEEQWNAITIGSSNDELLNANIHFGGESGELAPSGSCGDALAWTLEDGVLTISGSGAMDDYDSDGAPWVDYADEITSVVADAGVTGIGDYAFYGFTALTAVSLPSSLTTIGVHAFSQCIALEDIDLPEGLTAIGDWAFMGSRLQSITIPGKVTDFGEGAFYWCGLNSVTISEGVKSIGSSAFYQCEMLTSVIIPEGVKSIGSKAFWMCLNLPSIVIPESVESIGNGAFGCCSALGDVYYGGSRSQWNAVQIGTDNEYLTSANIRFGETIASGVCGDYLTWELNEYGELTVSGIGPMDDYCEHILTPWASHASEIVSLTVCAGVTSIGSGAFADTYTALKSVDLPEGLTSIGECAFALCGVLNSIALPESVTSIGSGAFAGCSALGDVYYGGRESQWNAVQIGIGNECLTSANIHFGETVASGQVGDYLTWELNEYRTLTISGSGEMWDCDWAFVPNAPWSDHAEDILEVVIKEGVAGIGNEAFYGCTALRSVRLPASLTRIGDGAFEDCYLLKDVVIPANVASIGERAFYGCSALTGITIPDGVTSLPYGVFEGCTALKSVSLPATLTRIGEAVFGYCTALTSVTIPVNVTYIELGAFKGCTALKNVYYDGNPDQWDSIFIGDFNDEFFAAKLHCVLATGVKLFVDGENVGGKTVFCALPDTLGDGSVTISAEAAPSAAAQSFAWTCSDTAGAYGELSDNGDGTATFTSTTGKTGSVTITAKATDGSGKYAKVIVKIGKLATNVALIDPPVSMRGGASVTLKTDVQSDKTLTDRSVVWTLSDDSVPYATLSAAGKLTTRKVFEQVTIRVTATVKARPELEQTIDILLYPAVTEAQIFRNGEFMPKNTLIPVQLSEGTVQLTGSTYPVDAMQSGTWKSSSTKIATVDETGKVTLLKAGTATITFTAADGTKKSTSVKLVIGNWVTGIGFTGLEIGESGPELNLLSGRSATVKAVATPGNATNKKVTWSTEDKNIATVSSSGRVSAKTVRRDETTVITATAADGGGEVNHFKVNVRPARDTLSLWDEDVDVTGKTLTIPYTEGLNCNTPAVKLYTAADGSFNESVDPADVTWKTGSAKIATVENGEVKFLKAGTVTITAVCGKLSAKLTIKTVVPVESVSIAALQSNELVSGKCVTLKATVLPTDATNKKLTWTSSNTAAATVSSSGKVTAKTVKERTDVTITATAADGSGEYAEYVLTIVPKATGITIRDNLFRVMNNRKESISLSERPQLQLSAIVFPNGDLGAQQSVTWTSSSKKIAAIDENGSVTLLKKGTVTIKATALDGSKVYASFKIVVTE